MSDQQSRRNFLKQASVLPLCAAVMGSGLMGKVSAVADSLPKPATSGPLKVSINAYSFSKMLNDNIKHRGPGITLIQALEFAAKCKSDGFDATGYFMPNYPERPTDA